MNRKTHPAWLTHESGLFLIVIVEWLYFDLAGTRFGTIDNAFELLRHSTEYGLLALAITPVILAGGIDLSVGSLLGLCAIAFGKSWRDAHLPIAAAAAVALLVGTAGGGLNGLLISRFRLPPLIVTLATFALFRGLAEALTRGVDTFTGFPEIFLRLGQGQYLGLPTQATVFFLVAGSGWLLVHATTFGRCWRAIGFAPEGARFAGLPVGARVTQTYLMAGFTSGLAAIIYTARLGQARADAGTGYELIAITAVVLGGTSIFGGRGTVYGTLLGVAALAVLSNGLIHARQPREVAGMLTGFLLITALALPVAAGAMVHAWQARQRTLSLARERALRLNS
jgi:rhamnose transport system permease protein